MPWVAILRLYSITDGKNGRCCHTFLADLNTSTPRWSSENKRRKDRDWYTVLRQHEVTCGEFFIRLHASGRWAVKLDLAVAIHTGANRKRFGSWMTEATLTRELTVLATLLASYGWDGKALL